MMEIPSGKTCGVCRFFHPGEENESECGMFEDPTMRDHKVVCGRETYFGIALTDWNLEERYYNRAAECLAAYPNGATVTITPKGLPVQLLPSDATADIMLQLAHETAEGGEIVTVTSKEVENMMEIPAGKYCDQGQEPNCPLFPCLFDYGSVTCVPDVYRGVDVVTKRCPACLAAYPYGGTVTITPKDAVNE